jgi:phosphoglycolate phosphatase
LIKNLLFDFDGTIVDTSEGIIKSMHYAFEKLELEKLNDFRIKEVIGPPLGEMFKILININNEETITKGIHYFRERYSRDGLRELKLYDNVEDTLSYLHNIGINMFIVTSKPHKFTETIVENLNVKKYFKDISGVGLSGEVKSKADRIGEMVNKYNLITEETLMVGDMKDDVLAANENKIRTIGMLYGFGKKLDLQIAGCKTFCDKFEELKNII